MRANLTTMSYSRILCRNEISTIVHLAKNSGLNYIIMLTNITRYEHLPSFH